MFFGVNNRLNYNGVKKQHQLSIKKLETSPVNKLEEDKIKSPVTENLIILSLSLIGGVLVSKYIFH